MPFIVAAEGIQPTDSYQAASFHISHVLWLNYLEIVFLKAPHFLHIIS